MSQVTPENFYVKLAEWMELEKELARVKEQEMTLRKDLFDFSFPNPKEGTQRQDLPDGWKLKGEYKLNRKVDETQLPVIFQRLREEFNVTNPAELVKIKYDLSVSSYKKLPEEARLVMDQALTVSPGSPALTVEPPKASK